MRAPRVAEFVELDQQRGAASRDESGYSHGYLDAGGPVNTGPELY